MRLKTGRTSSAWRVAVTSASVVPASTASRASEKPMAFSVRMPTALRRQAVARGPCASMSTMPRISLEEPRIDLAGVEDVLVATSRAASPARPAAAGPASACRARRGWRSCRRRWPRPSISISSRPVRPVSSPRSAFCRLSWKVRPIAITSPTDFIDVVSVVLGAGEFLEGEARDLGDDVVDGRLERGRRRAAGDVVGDLVERVADRELGGDLGDRKAGRLRGQRGGARHARVHLDHDHAAVCRD